MLCSWPWSNRI
uniref:Uncharacterized protein n=1 Tax=Anguilla anguilla TaxID=7936 RepID=A0A0E9VRE7_ANGAN